MRKVKIDLLVRTAGDSRVVARVLMVLSHRADDHGDVLDDRLREELDLE
jgi:hypothetical protein